MLVAFLCQSVIVQTHIHFAMARTKSPALRYHGAQSFERARLPTDRPVYCPICQELAQAGHYVSPGVVAFVLLLPVFDPVVGTSLGHVVKLSSWYGWQSRAPPQSIRA
jgi:hypothetical protein